MSHDLIAKVAFLKIPPEAWDAIIPHSHKISQYVAEYMVAGVVRDIAKEIKHEGIQKKVMHVGKEMATMASAGLVQGWEDGDDICPPWRWPWPWPNPHPWWEVIKRPPPLPWSVGVAEQIVLADLLVSLAGVTANRDFSVQLKELSVALVQEVSAQLVESFEKTEVTPRSQTMQQILG